MAYNIHLAYPPVELWIHEVSFGKRQYDMWNDLKIEIAEWATIEYCLNYYNCFYA